MKETEFNLPQCNMISHPIKGFHYLPLLCFLDSNNCYVAALQYYTSSSTFPSLLHEFLNKNKTYSEWPIVILESKPLRLFINTMEIHLKLPIRGEGEILSDIYLPLYRSRPMPINGVTSGGIRQVLVKFLQQVSYEEKLGGRTTLPTVWNERVGKKSSQEHLIEVLIGNRKNIHDKKISKRSRTEAYEPTFPFRFREFCMKSLLVYPLIIKHLQRSAEILEKELVKLRFFYLPSSAISLEDFYKLQKCSIFHTFRKLRHIILSYTEIPETIHTSGRHFQQALGNRLSLQFSEFLRDVFLASLEGFLTSMKKATNHKRFPIFRIELSLQNVTPFSSNQVDQQNEDNVPINEEVEWKIICSERPTSYLALVDHIIDLCSKNVISLLALESSEDRLLAVQKNTYNELQNIFGSSINEIDSYICEVNLSLGIVLNSSKKILSNLNDNDIITYLQHLQSLELPKAQVRIGLFELSCQHVLRLLTSMIKHHTELLQQTLSNRLCLRGKELLQNSDSSKPDELQLEAYSCHELFLQLMINGYRPRIEEINMNTSLCIAAKLLKKN